MVSEASAPRLRFAPSPTGRLHVGNAYIALANWLYGRRHGGSFLLRFDDTDRERSTAAFAAGIEADLLWLGLAWDEKASQSARLPRYDEAAFLTASVKCPRGAAQKRKAKAIPSRNWVRAARWKAMR